MAKRLDGMIKLVLGPGHFVLDRDPTPPKGAQPPSQFSAHVYCGRTAGWIKMPFGREAGLSPGDIVLDGDPAPPPPQRGHSPLQFLPMSVVAKRLDGSRCHLVRRQASAQSTLCSMGTKPPKGAQHPLFSAHVYCGPTVAHLSYC